LCEVCFWQNRQYFLNSTRDGWVRRFLVAV